MRVTWQDRDKYEEWQKERQKQLEEEYKDKPLEVGRDDILAMIIAAFQVLTPIFLLVAFIIFLVFFIFSGTLL